MPERVNIPVRGATDAARYRELPPGFCPLESIRNVRVFTSSGKPQIGTRPGLETVFSGLGSGQIQGMCVLNRPSVSAGYSLGDPQDAGDGTSRSAIAPTGNLWVIDGTSRGVLYNHTLESDVATAAPYPNCTAVAFSRDGTLLIAAHTEWNVYGKLMIRVRCLNAATGATLWTTTYNSASSTLDRYVVAGAICCTNDFVFIGAKTDLLALRLTGANAGTLYQVGTLNGWASEIASLGTYRVGNLDVLFAAFQGTTTTNTMVSGGSFGGSALPSSITAGICAQHFRTGVMKWHVTINPDTNTGATGYPCQRFSFGTQLGSTDPGFETDGPHGYFRIWEQSAYKPHGCYISDMAVNASGSIVLARSNQGWGPAATPWRPGGTGGSYAPLVPDVTLMRVSNLGTTVWEIDPGSNHGDGTTGNGYDGVYPHFNDINAPTMRACAIDANGAVYASGYQNESGYSVVRVSGGGSVDWRANVVPAGSACSISAIAVDPTDGNPIVATPWNSGWTGSGGANAHLFKLSANDGRIIWALDVAAVSVQGLAIAVSPSGVIAFGTDYVP